MPADDDRQTDHEDRHDAAEPFAPPGHGSRLRGNWMMLAVMIVVLLAVVVFIVALATD